MEEFWREDKIKTWDGAQDFMQNVPEAIGNLFKVPPVVG